MLLIGISGKANSGKNTVANNIISELGNGAKVIGRYRSVAFADPIKDIVMKMFPLANEDELWGASEMRAKIIPGSITNVNPDGLTYRKILCDLGALGRSYDENIWVNVFEANFKRHCNDRNDYTTYICSDVRFTNEFEILKSLGFYIVRIIRDSYLKTDDISETSQDSIPDSAFDKIVDNNGSLEFLKEQCTKIVLELQGK